MSFDFFKNKSLEIIDFIISKNIFKKYRLKQKERNMNFNVKLLYEVKRDIQFVAKCTRIPLKIFIELIITKSSQSLIEIKE